MKIRLEDLYVHIGAERIKAKLSLVCIHFSSPGPLIREGSQPKPLAS